MIEDFMTPEEVAERLKLDIQTVRRFLRDGRLQGHRFGRAWRIPVSAIEAFIEETKYTPRPAVEAPAVSASRRGKRK